MTSALAMALACLFTRGMLAHCCHAAEVGQAQAGNCKQAQATESLTLSLLLITSESHQHQFAACRGGRREDMTLQTSSFTEQVAINGTYNPK
jgi:hypothetical protein